MDKRGLGGLVAAVAVFWQGFGPGTAAATAADPPRPVFAARGAGSCSATACHGGTAPSPGRVLRNEHATWLTQDRHADAYRVLTDDRSRRIADRLPGPKVAAEKDARCLACHSTPVAAPGPVDPIVLRSDGVGCESCHGASDGWVSKHVELGWAGQSPAFKAGFGMTPTEDLVSRARVCAGCHVGAPARDGLPARDVNHDLIAAGHPRLNFEFSAYLANMAHHWREDVGPEASAEFPARAWAIGQVVAAQAALDLLRDRAARAGAEPADAAHARTSSAWPEFTEFGCFSCHHDLRDDEFRRKAPVVTSPPGRGKWGSWHYPLLSALADAGPKADAETLRAALNDLRGKMDGPDPEPADVGKQAAIVSEQLGQWLDRLSARNFDADLIKDLYARVADLQARGEVRSWDEATQRYLALVPLSQALQMLGAGPDRTRELTAMRGVLEYRPGYDSPTKFNATAPAPAP